MDKKEVPGMLFALKWEVVKRLGREEYGIVVLVPALDTTVTLVETHPGHGQVVMERIVEDHNSRVVT